MFAEKREVFGVPVYCFEDVIAVNRQGVGQGGEARFYVLGYLVFELSERGFKCFVNNLTAGVVLFFFGPY